MIKALRAPLLVVALVVGVAGAAVATPAVDFGPPTPLARGTLAESVHYNTGEVKFQTKGAVDFVTQTITIGGQGRIATSGWHTHPGVVLVTVASGTLVRYEADCSATTYGAGDAFTEAGGHPALVRNEQPTTPAVVYVTYVVPEGTALLRHDAANPGCPQN